MAAAFQESVDLAFEGQSFLYESLQFLGPVASALAAGFAAYGPTGDLCVTPAGERYVQVFDSRR